MKKKQQQAKHLTLASIHKREHPMHPDVDIYFL